MPHGAIPFPFGDCRVCSDKATGVHYGVATCEGCKGFFKRSLPKADKYRCFNNGQCTFDRNDRNRCKSCRFRRCLDVGMSLEGVKMGRIPKVDKERALEQHRSGTVEDGEQFDAVSKHSSKNGSPEPHIGEDPPKSRNQTPLSGDSGIEEGWNGRNRAGFFTESSADRANERRMENSKGIPDKQTFMDREWNAGAGAPPGRYLVPEVTGRNVGELRAGGGLWATGSAGEIGESLVRRLHGNPLPSHEKWGEMVKNRHNGLTVSVDDHGSVDAEPCDLRAKVEPSSVQYAVSPQFSRQGFPTSNRPTTNPHAGFFHPRPDSTFSSAQRKLTVDVNLKYPAQIFSPVPEMRPLPSPHPVIVQPAVVGPQWELQERRRALSTSSQDGHSMSPYGPNVIRELLDQVIQTGHAREVQHNIARQFVSTSAHSPPINYNSASLSRSNSCVDISFVCGHKRPNLVDTAAAAHGRPVEREFTPPPAKIERTASSVDISGERGSVDSVELAPDSGSPADGKRNTVSSSSIAGPWLSSSFRPAKASSPCGVASLPLSLVCPTVAEEDWGDLTIDDTTFAQHAEFVFRDSSGKFVDIVVPSIQLPEIPGDVSAGFSGEELATRRSETDAVLQCLKHVSNVFVRSILLSVDATRLEECGERERHPLNTADRSQPDVVVKVWNELMGSIPMVNSYILGMCTRIPGFDDLNQKDKATLMEAAYFEMWLIQWCTLLRNNDSHLRFPTGLRYSRALMVLFLPDSLVRALFKFAEELNSCHLTPVEHTILCAIQLTNTAGRNLVDADRVQRLHDYYLDLLAYEIERNHRATHSRILIKIFQLLPMLTPINIEQAEVIMNLRVDSPPEATLAELTKRLDETKSTPSPTGSASASTSTTMAASPSTG